MEGVTIRLEENKVLLLKLFIQIRLFGLLQVPLWVFHGNTIVLEGAFSFRLLCFQKFFYPSK